MARLKVFSATIGFFDTVVATPSRRAALEAWGARQDLFGEGLAAATDDPAAKAAALAHPGTVLRRAAGSKSAFEPSSGSLRSAETSMDRRPTLLMTDPEQPPRRVPDAVAGPFVNDGSG